jgi:hypothetical protein
MAISDIITGGFGTFSTAFKIPTRGFSIGTSIVVVTTVGCVQVLAMPTYGLVVFDMATGAVATYHTPVSGLAVYDLPTCPCTRC